MATGIIDLSQPGAAPSEVTAQVCIIGSGAGGGTAARVLAEAGLDVVVLEEGGHFTPDTFTQRDAEMYDQLYMDRGGRATEDLSIAVLQGRVLGGGPVINACDVVPIPDGVLRHWQNKHGLSGYSKEALAPHLKATLADLSASPIPEDMVNAANAKLREGARKLKLRGEVMHHNRVDCVGLGTCFLGCPVEAKQNPRTVAIPKAIAAGARFYVRARAVAITHATSDTKRVTVRALDSRGYREGRALTIKAAVVIVAANAIASAQLLLRSGLGNAHVGRNLMLQPQLPIVAQFNEPIEAFLGIPQAYAVTEHEVEDHPEHGLWGYRIEGVMGTPGLVATMLPFTGKMGKEMMSGYAHMAGALLLAPDKPSGRVELLPDRRPLIRYTHGPDHKARLRHAVKVAAQAYLAAGATRVIVPTARPLVITKTADLAAVAAIGFEPATVPMISAHQQGTVRFAGSATQGGADPDGQVYGTRGVYVFDSSGFPSSSSSHTMTPIMTVSRYLCARLLTGLH